MNAVQPIDLALLCVAGLLLLWGIRYLGVIVFSSLKLVFVGALALGLVHSTSVGRTVLTTMVSNSETLSPLLQSGAEILITARTIGTRLLAPSLLGAASPIGQTASEPVAGQSHHKRTAATAL